MRIQLLAPEAPVARPLRDALSARGFPPDVVAVRDVRIDTDDRAPRLDLVVNLVGGRSGPVASAFTVEYLSYLGDLGLPVVNGLDAFVIGASPARQLALLGHLGVHHPPARVVAERSGVAAALAELGLAPDDVVVTDGPPVVVQAKADVGEVVRIHYVAGREVGAVLANGEAVRVEEPIVRLGAELVRTGGIEFGAVSFGYDPVRKAAVCVGVDIELDPSEAVVDALVDHILRRAGIGA